ncbi:hypothetical protein WEH80_33730 [Actinomycetes bacterium KLBMP 9759]
MVLQIRGMLPRSDFDDGFCAALVLVVVAIALLSCGIGFIRGEVDAHTPLSAALELIAVPGVVTVLAELFLGSPSGTLHAWLAISFAVAYLLLEAASRRIDRQG